MSSPISTHLTRTVPIQVTLALPEVKVTFTGDGPRKVTAAGGAEREPELGEGALVTLAAGVHGDTGALASGHLTLPARGPYTVTLTRLGIKQGTCK